MKRIVLISALLVSAFSPVFAGVVLHIGRWHGYGDNSGDMCGSCGNINV